MKPNLEPQGMFKSLSPDLAFVPDQPMAKKVNTTTTHERPTQISIHRPGNISKEAISAASKGRLQYKVPKQSEDFTFKTSGTNEARTRSAIQLSAKKDQPAAGSKGAADQVKVSPPSA